MAKWYHPTPSKLKTSLELAWEYHLARPFTMMTAEGALHERRLDKLAAEPRKRLVSSKCLHLSFYSTKGRLPSGVKAFHHLMRSKPFSKCVRCRERVLSVSPEWARSTDMKSHSMVRWPFQSARCFTPATCPVLATDEDFIECLGKHKMWQFNVEQDQEKRMMSCEPHKHGIVLENSGTSSDINCTLNPTGSLH